MTGNWRYISASVTGTSHIEKNIPCQDFHLCRAFETPHENVLIIVASDGAGSARFSHIGSEKACTLLAGKIESFLQDGNLVADIEKNIAQGWLEEILEEFTYMASAENACQPDRQASVRDYACTILAAVISETSAVFMQIGDGGIVVGNEDELDTFCWIFWPEKGNYANVTYFLTDADMAEHIQFDNMNRNIKQVAVFTDGIERLAFNYSVQEVFNPFFKGLFSNLNSGKDVEELNAALTDFLNSDRINERTDDDKTLVLATCN